jgi:hypothetical protein
LRRAALRCAALALVACFAHAPFSHLRLLLLARSALFGAAAAPRPAAAEAPPPLCPFCADGTSTTADVPPAGRTRAFDAAVVARVMRDAADELDHLTRMTHVRGVPLHD